ncbi:MAG: hypothetical protein PHC52_05795, partial [Syntrophales bacterium]|nr:hypothetical protein [Syntrophales bacterium]
TNGITWNAYRLKFEIPISYELLFSLNFLELNARKQEDQDRLFLLCREGLEKAAIEEFHKYISNVNKFIISAIIQDIPAINVIRRELRKISPGLKIERDEIERILINEVFKRDVLESEQFKDAKARLKKYLKKRRATADSNKCEVNLNSESESPDQAELTEQMKAEGSAFDIGQL